MVARVFLSAVSSEFGAARDALADALQALDMSVRVQRSFLYDPTAGTLLHQLANYIETCEAVVCLIGTRSGGGFPEREEAAPFLDRGILPPGIAEASYTQWEFFLARHFKRRHLVYVATDRFLPNAPAEKEDRPDLQAAFATHVRALGMRAPRVDSAGDFRAEVLKDMLVPPPADKPIVLPYPSLGTLFKGRDGFLDRLHASLARTGGGTAAIAGRALHGMGGVGKTRAAVEYAWAHRGDYTALLCSTPRPRTNCNPASPRWSTRCACPQRRRRPKEAARVEAVLGLAQRQSQLVPDPRQHRHRARPGRRPPAARAARRRPRAADQPPGGVPPRASSAWTWTC